MVNFCGAGRRLSKITILKTDTAYSLQIADYGIQELIKATTNSLLRIYIKSVYIKSPRVGLKMFYTMLKKIKCVYSIIFPITFAI